MQNKDTVVAFYDTTFNQSNPRKAIGMYVGDEYVQHNPAVLDGKHAFIEYFEQMARDYLGNPWRSNAYPPRRTTVSIAMEGSLNTGMSCSEYH